MLKKLVLIIILLFIPGLAKTTWAGFDAKNLSLRVGMGVWATRDGDSQNTFSKRLTAYGDFFALGYQPHDKLRGELSLSFWGKDDFVTQSTGNQLLSGRATIHLIPVILSGHFLPLPNQTFHPYIGAGLGLYFSSARSQIGPPEGKIDLTKKMNRLGFSLSAGFDVDIDQHWQLVTDVKYHIIKFNEQLFEEQAFLGDPRNFTGWQGTLGFRILWGDTNQ